MTGDEKQETAHDNGRVSTTDDAPDGEPAFADTQSQARLAHAPNTALESRVLAIVGLGLMGGSLALALKKQNAVKKILGVSRTPATINAALARGIVDDAGDDLQLAREADLIVLAAPVRTILKQLPLFGSIARNGALILDLGSTKRAIVETMNQLPARLFAVGGHPMCGKETSGLEAADADLYRDKVFILTPTARSTEGAMQTAEELAQSIGSRVINLDASRHDQIAAAISHLPYVVASNLARTIGERAESDERVWELASSGFRDTTRVAASDTTMMMDILMTNSENIAEMMREYSRTFAELADMIYSEDEEKLRARLEDAKSQRQRQQSYRDNPAGKNESNQANE